MANYTSERLVPGAVYTRKDLMQLFSITDATIKTGIFRPKGFDSVWLFVTEHKTSDRTPYDDALTGDTLRIQGQLKGRTDALIRDHQQSGLELLLFHRKKKYEYDGAGFKFEGAFYCEEHTLGPLPSTFHLRRVNSAEGDLPEEVEQELTNEGAFDPTDVSDARHRVFASIARRRGQKAFRNKLLNAYGGQCAVTQCAIGAILEAAHIYPYQGSQTNVTSNGILLRADIHTLFDLGLLWIEPDTLLIRVVEKLQSSEYAVLDKKPLSLPAKVADHPSPKALTARNELINQP